MMMRFQLLGSSSAGNCALVQAGDVRVLIDAGFSARRLGQLLAEAGTSLEAVDAIFLTHEHGDHTAGISGLAKYPRLKIFANAATASVVQTKLPHRPDWQIFETGARFRYRDLEIVSFALPHDAHEPVGFRISTGSDNGLSTSRRTLVWATDLGHAPQHVCEHLKDADVVVIEANYCTALLQADTRRPWALKQRISGRHGHLSNQAARELLEAAATPRWRHVYLAHLSRDCNTPAAVEATCGTWLAARNCAYSIIAPGTGAPSLDF